MLTFVVTFEIFERIKNNLKTWEYREITPYWNKRISKLNKGDQIKITRGYDKQHIKAKVKTILLLRYKHLPLNARRFFQDMDHKRNLWNTKYYAINFELV